MLLFLSLIIILILSLYFYRIGFLLDELASAVIATISSFAILISGIGLFCCMFNAKDVVKKYEYQKTYIEKSFTDSSLSVQERIKLIDLCDTYNNKIIENRNHYKNPFLKGFFNKEIADLELLDKNKIAKAKFYVIDEKSITIEKQ